MTTTIVRLLVAAWILLTLARAARATWAQRRLVVAVWRAIRPRHVAGAVGLLALVAATAVALLSLLPVTSVGLGSVVGITSNAVFVPLEEAASRAPAAVDGGPRWTVIVLATSFLAGLSLLLPWLAFVEEEVFRAGLEDASLPRQVTSALVFGLAHLVMLVPLAATLAVGVAGFLYGRAYRRGYHRSDAASLPTPVLAAFRPTRRSRAAAARARSRERRELAETTSSMLTDSSVERRQAAGVFASAVWHTTFNTLVVVLVWASLVYEAL